MSTYREKLISKIQRLLALSSGTIYEEEAKAALSAAQKLMIDNAIHMSEVESTQIKVEKDWVDEFIQDTSSRDWADEKVMMIIKRFFFVEPYYYKISGQRMKKKIRFFGDRENVVMARHVFLYLTGVFERLWFQYSTTRVLQGHAIAVKRAYITGLFSGFWEKLREERELESSTVKNALVRITDELMTKFNQSHPGLIKGEPRTPISANEAHAYTEGYQDGKQINLHKPIDQTQSPVKGVLK